MIVDVALLPSLALELEKKVAVVVDGLRASTTLITMFEQGAPSVIVADGPQDVFRLTADQRDRFWLCGEVGGRPEEGYDFGNSPSQISRHDLAGRAVVFSTSNGTRALMAVADAAAVLVGAGRNARAVAVKALNAAERLTVDITLVCAGDEQGTLFSLEDAFFAGCIVEQLAGLRPFGWPVDESEPGAGDPSTWILDESAVLVRRLVRSYLSAGSQDMVNPRTVGLMPNAADVMKMFQDARNGQSLPRIGYVDDLAYCAALDQSEVVPLLSRRDGRFVLTVQG